MAVNNSKKTNGTPRPNAKKKPKQNLKKKKNMKRKKIFKTLFFMFLFCFLSLVVVVSGYTFAIIKTTPPLDVNKVLSLNQVSSVYDSNGNFMDNLLTTEERFVVNSDKIPDNLKNAFVSIEDERFYTHSGIDLKRIIGAAILDVKKIISGKKGLHGASTLTQQLLKNTVLTNEVSIERKIKEIYLALNLEQRLNKDQILTAYLNTIPLGGHSYGVQAASLLYFSKDVCDLSLVECAYLAGITQAPTYYSAYNQKTKDSKPYIDRTITVLSKMYERQCISKSEYDEAVENIKNEKLIFKPTTKSYRLNYEWFVYPVLNEVKADLQSKYNYTDDEVSKLLINGGLKIYTTMDRDLQDFTQKTLNDYSKLGISNKEDFDADGIPLIQASATIVDYKEGKVLAMVGGRGLQHPQSINRAYDGLRPTGSSSKPVLVYGPGIDKGIITAATAVDDAPLPPNKLNNGSHYDPKNSPNHYSGLMSARESLVHSKNTAAVSFASKIGLENCISYGEELGLKFNSVSRNSIAAVALGEFNNSPQDQDGANTYIMASAFGTFGNNGVYKKPKLYTKVLDSSGKVLLNNKTSDEKQVFSEETAYIMYDILKGPVNEYNATGARFSDMPVSGKTGTSSDSKDLWFAGLSPYLSASVWIGYDNPKKLSGSSSGCATLWGTLMRKAHEDLEIKDIDMPPGIIKTNVCVDSGLLPSDLCSQDQRGNRIKEELFIEGTEPTTTCKTHVLANVNILNNKLATPGTPSIITKGSVFIKKDYLNPNTDDYAYVLPSSYDTSVNNSEYSTDNEKEDSTTNNNSVDESSNKDKTKKKSILDIFTGKNGSDANKDENNETTMLNSPEHDSLINTSKPKEIKELH